MSKVIVFGDKHYPFNIKEHDTFILKQIKIHKPDYVVDVGDLYDQYFHSRFDKDFNIMSPDEELKKARAKAVAFWKKVRALVPKAKCIQLVGNHDQRMIKLVLNKVPSIATSVENIRRDLYSFEGVTSYHSDRDFVEIDNVVYCHGWLGTNFSHYRMFNKSVVHGHFHKATIIAQQNVKTNNKFIFEMCVGCGLDPNTVPASYTASKVVKGQRACGLVDDGIPRLFLMED